MQVNFEITMAEFKHALKLYSRETLGRRVHWFIYDYVIPAIGLASLLITLLAYLTSNMEAVNSLISLDVVIVAGVALSYLVRRSRVRSMFRALLPPGAKSRSRSMEFGDQGIVSSLEGVGKTHYEWSAIVKCVHDSTVALLFISTEQFLLVPLRVLSSAEHAEFNEIIARHVALRKSC